MTCGGVRLQSSGGCSGGGGGKSLASQLSFAAGALAEQQLSLLRCKHQSLQRVWNMELSSTQAIFLAEVGR